MLLFQPVYHPGPFQNRLCIFISKWCISVHLECTSLCRDPVPSSQLSCPFCLGASVQAPAGKSNSCWVPGALCLHTWCSRVVGEGNGTPLHCSCLENPMDRGTWWAAVHGIAKSRTWLSDFTFTFMHWRRKWQPTPVFLPGESQGRGSLVGCRLWGSHRVGHDWSDLAAAAAAFTCCISPQSLPQSFTSIFWVRFVELKINGKLSQLKITLYLYLLGIFQIWSKSVSKAEQTS